MSNIEHLIENALTAMEKNPDDTYQAFEEEISKTYNQQMLEAVAISKNELWAIAQYIFYTWLPNVGYKDLVPQGEWIETTYKSFIPTEQPENGFVVTHSHVGYRCSRCGRVEDKKEPFCHCGARMK